MKYIFALLITTIAYSIQNDIPFWSGQFKEHAEFCVDFTDNEMLKQEGSKLAQQFENLKNSNKANNFVRASNRIKKFQRNVDQSLKKDDPRYSIRHDLIDHMNKETDYAIKRVKNKKLSKQEEIQFWSAEHEGEAKAIAYYSTNADETAEAKQLENTLKHNNSLKRLQDANANLNSIGVQLEQEPQFTKMPKKLAEHEKRERKRAQEILKSLDNQEQ